MQLFQTGIFYLVTYLDSAMSFHGLIVHFLLILNSVALYGFTIVYLFIYISLGEMVHTLVPVNFFFICDWAIFSCIFACFLIFLLKLDILNNIMCQFQKSDLPPMVCCICFLCVVVACLFSDFLNYFCKFCIICHVWPGKSVFYLLTRQLVF